MVSAAWLLTKPVSYEERSRSQGLSVASTCLVSELASSQRVHGIPKGERVGERIVHLLTVLPLFLRVSEQRLGSLPGFLCPL